MAPVLNAACMHCVCVCVCLFLYSNVHSKILGIVLLGLKLVFGVSFDSDMKNLIGEASCGICQESFSTNITGVFQ